MKTLLTGLLLLGLAITTGMGQGVSARFKMGYGVYQMKTLKNAQQSTVNQQPIPAKATDTYPPHFNFQGQVAYHLNEQGALGVFWGYASTGGRVHYSDYSGEMKVDDVVWANNIGVLYEGRLYHKNVFSVLGSMQVSATLSALRYESSVTLYETDYEQKFITEASTVGIGVEPGIVGRFEKGRLLASIDLGFHYSQSKPFYVDGNEDNVVINYITQERIRPNWSGWRAGVSLGVFLVKKS